MTELIQMKRDSLFLVALSLFIVAMFTFGSKIGMKVQSAMAGPIPEVRDSANLATVSQTIEGFGTSRTAQSAAALGGKTVPVYSRYPFALKNELLIAAGEKDGVKVGDVALFQGSILGSIEKVYEDSALVQTVFDSRFKAPVRIGSSAANALLVGGPQPRLTLIPIDAAIGNDDQVYAASEGWPYGAALGVLEDMKKADDNIYRSATLRVLYDTAALSSVVVVPKGS